MNYVIFLKFCDWMCFEVNCGKLHHCVISDGLPCDQLTPRQRATPMAANPQVKAVMHQHTEMCFKAMPESATEHASNSAVPDHHQHIGYFLL